MEAATLTLDNRVYDTAQRYARLHRTSVEQLFSHFVLTLALEDEQEAAPVQGHNAKAISRLSPKLQALVGIARKNGQRQAQDINARDMREQYLFEKYGQ